MDNIFLTTFFFTFTFICAKNIRYGIYAVIFLMPSYLLRFSIFGIPTTVLEIMTYILFLVWILNKIKKNNFYPGLAEGSNGFSRFIRKNNFILSTGITLLFLGLILSTLHSSDLRTSLGICKGWFFDPFLFFVIFITVIKEKKHIILSLASWVFSGVAVSLISVFYLLNNNLTFDDRLSAFYISPNYLAMYLAPAFLIVLFFLLNNSLSFPSRIGVRDKLRRESTAKISNSLRIILSIKQVSSIKYQILSVIILAIIFIPLFFTYSYGAFLGIFTGAIWLFYKTQTRRSDRSARSTSPVLNSTEKYIKNKQSKIKNGTSKRSGGICKHNLLSFINYLKIRIYPLTDPSAPIVARDDKLKRINKKLFLKILILIILIAFISITAVKFNQIINSENRSSFHSRLMIWNTSAEIIKDNPIFGIGPGTFQKTYLAYAEKFDEPYLEWAVPQPHNTFLAFYLQTGLIGFVGFILILVWFFYRRRDGSRPIPTIATVLMIYILVHGLVDTMYWKNDLSLMFWLIIGLAWCYRNFSKDIDFFNIKC